MKRIGITLVLIIVSLVAVAKKDKKEEKMTLVLIETSLGEIKVGLYNDTPLHRDNFLKLIKENFYPGVLFHRVIKDFMIQAGDPYSKVGDPELQLGSGDVGYKVPAEIIFPKYYHKFGALAAARQGDAYNPKKESSGCQFYIVQGKQYTEQELKDIEHRMNMSRKSEDQFQYNADQRMHYKMFGGTPHLDGQYTVFGEVVEGFEVVNKIAEVKTGRGDRPVEDVKIIAVRVVKR